MPTEKVSATLDKALVDESRRYAGSNLSAYLNEALMLRVLQDRARLWLEQEEAERGPIPEDLMREVEAEWPE